MLTKEKISEGLDSLFNELKKHDESTLELGGEHYVRLSKI
jgi:hypothetical protein